MALNVYGRQLSPAEIEKMEHRDLVGGLWEEHGARQFNFRKGHGPQTRHRPVDLGCGALPGGLHFLRYLDAGHYNGIDIKASLIEAGKRELEGAALGYKGPHLLVNDRFGLGSFATAFDCAIAVSVLSHLPMNHIGRCLVELRKALRPDARFFASLFEALVMPTSRHRNTRPATS